MAEKKDQNADFGSKGSERNSARRILLAGVFWRILIIEVILLVWSVAYRAISADSSWVELFWYAQRIIILIAIIVLFMMVTLRRFLDRKIITPLEAISEANRRVRYDHPEENEITLPDDTPEEIREIATTRSQMLSSIFLVSEERLRLVKFIKDTFGRYLSKKVVDEILESPEGRKIGGRRQTVTILMSDLRGFTGLSETRDPEEMVLLLNRYFDRMSRVIYEYDGMIDEFIGDAILVVFGAPEKKVDDPERAVACALAMQNALQELNDEIQREGYPPLEMGIGINTGPVIVGNIGSELRLKYGIVGATVNLASRIESNSTGGQVLIGLSTHALVKDLVEVLPPMTVMMKGLKRPLVSYPVTAIGPPFDVKLVPSNGLEEEAEIRLPFLYWEIKDKKIGEQAFSGQSLRISTENITATMKSPLPEMSDIKLVFQFCTEAHCFGDIYAKVASVETGDKEQAIHQLRITSIDDEDRQILNGWMESAST